MKSLLIFNFIIDSFQGAALFLESFGIKGFLAVRFVNYDFNSLNILLSKHGSFVIVILCYSYCICTSFFL